VGKATEELLRSVLTLVLVVGGTAGLLAALDSAPGCIQGVPRGVRNLKSIDEAERRLRGTLALPAFFPDTLQWPPSAIRAVQDTSPAVALAFQGRAGGVELWLAQTMAGDGPIPPSLLPPATVLGKGSVAVGGEEATLSRIVGEDGTIWHEIAWRQFGRRLVLRGKGPLDQLVRMARSAHREGA
jgi:hypothetical protein